MKEAEIHQIPLPSFAQPSNQSDYLKSSPFFLFRGLISRLKSHIIYHLEWLFLIISLLMPWNLEVKPHPLMHNKENLSKGLSSLPFPTVESPLTFLYQSWASELGKCSHTQVSGRASSSKFCHHMLSWVKIFFYKYQSMSYSFMDHHEETKRN